MGERFIVRETRGYSIGRAGVRTSIVERSSFAVLDRRDCHREVKPGAFYVRPSDSRGEPERRRQAEALAAELNEWDRETRCA